MIWRRRFIWSCIAAAIVLAQVTEEVVGNESTAVDRNLLIAIHDDVPASLLGLFNAVTLSASAHVLIPLVALLTLFLCIRRHWFEAASLALSTASASLVVYISKSGFDRVRPALWDTQWYWGSSFPSGHTLSAAAVATALCLAMSRLRPQRNRYVVPIAISWVALVALSRLVLGVHWPTDVVAAACAGLLIAAGVNAALAFVAQGKAA